MYLTWAVRSYGNNIATNVKTSTLLFGETYFMLFLLKKSKEFFDYDFGYSQTKKDFLSKKNCHILFTYL